MKASLWQFPAILASLCLLTAPVVSRAADPAAAVDALVPRLADADVSARYAAQMELQALASQASRPGRTAERAALGIVLADRAVSPTVPQPARAWIVRQLEYMGDAEAVPALSDLLSNEDDELRECARRALEKNPARSASAALRAGLERGGTGPWRIGLINALGWRRDPQAVALIAQELNDPATGATAARALGRIASPQAVELLSRSDNLDRIPEVAEGLMDAAQLLVAEGRSDAAGLLYRDVYRNSAFAPARAAALHGLARVHNDGFKELLAQVLSGTDTTLRHAAVAALAENPAPYIPTLVELLPNLASNTKIQVIPLLDAAAEPLLIAAASDDIEGVRLAALHTLGNSGTASCIPVLLQAAADDNRTVKAAAVAALRALRGSEVVDALMSEAMEGRPALRAAAIDALANRESPGVQPLLLLGAATDDVIVRRAALTALTQLGRDQDFIPLTQIALATSNPDAFDTLESMAERAEEPAPIARAVLLLTETDEPARLALLNVLGTLGGSEVMEMMRHLLTGAHSEAALVALGRWPTLDAVATLLKIASDDSAPSKPHALALQGAVRLIGSAESAPAARRAEAALQAWTAARDTSEQKLVLSIMGNVPDARLVDTLKPLLTNEAVKAEAVLAGVTLAQGLADADREAARDLAQALRAVGLSRNASRQLAPLLRN